MNKHSYNTHLQLLVLRFYQMVKASTLQNKYKLKQLLDIKNNKKSFIHSFLLIVKN